MKLESIDDAMPDGVRSVVLTHARFPGLFFELVISPDGLLVEFSARHRNPHPPATIRLYGGQMPPDAAPPNSGLIAARSFRRLPLGELTDLAVHAAREGARADLVAGRIFLPEFPDELEYRRRVAERWARGFAEQPRPGPKGRDLHDLALIASQYVEVLGQPKPVEVLRERLNLGVKQTRNLVYKARKAKLLTDVKPGRAGGTLTAKAIALLEEVHDGPR